MTNLPADHRPRERILRMGAGRVADAELLAVLLGSGPPGCSVIDLAADVLRAVGGAAGLLTTSTAEMTAFRGVGPVGACRILAAAELARRCGKGAGAPRISTRVELAALVLPRMRVCRDDGVLVVALSRQLRPIAMVMVGARGDGHPLVPVGEVLQRVVDSRGAAFAIAHRHTCGTTLPTDTDRTATRELRDAAAAQGVRFLDHLIVAGHAWAAVPP